MTWRGFVRGGLACLAGFLIGEYGSGFVLRVVREFGGTAAVVRWAWLPWIVAAVLAGVGAGLAVPATRRTPWWAFAVPAVLVTVGAFGVTAWYFAAVGVTVTGLPAASAVQVAVAAGLAVGFGVLRSRMTTTGERRSPVRPAPGNPRGTTQGWGTR
jgi:hypothetical protein